MIDLSKLYDYWDSLRDDADDEERERIWAIQMAIRDMIQSAGYKIYSDSNIDWDRELEENYEVFIRNLNIYRDFMGWDTDIAQYYKFKDLDFVSSDSLYYFSSRECF